ncbi:MAG: hypothetical protein IJE62_06195 [Clostridia bacterium]|nr:hypothetical protein [Clostridia bacterium]
MNDLHTHALPDIDDGAKTLEMAAQMLEESYRQGVRVCALTPHCTIHNEQALPRFLAKRQTAYENLKEYLKNRQVPKLVLGAEVYTDHDLSQHEGISDLSIGRSSYILLELPFASKYEWIAECVYSLNLMGLTVIIAHLDRYSAWKSIMEALAGLKVVYELSSSSFLTFFGRRLVKKIIQRNAKFIISSDMHNTTTRKCQLKDAFKKARKINPEFADKCLSEITII